MAKKGRVARILTTLHRVAGTPVSEALKRRQRSAVQRGDAGTRERKDKSRWRKRKDRERRKAAFEGAHAETGLPHGYHAGMTIMCVGEGDFSFALSLATLFDGDGANVLATSLDRRGLALDAYPDAADVVDALEASGAGVRFGIDVEEDGALERVARAWWKGEFERGGSGEGGDGGGGEGGNRGGDDDYRGGRGGRGAFDRVVFNFPDRGVGTIGSLAVKANQDVLTAFFLRARALVSVPDGEIHVAVASADAGVSSWNVVGVAARCGLVYRASLDFAPGEFPGYTHFKTLPHESLLLAKGKGGDDGAAVEACDAYVEEGEAKTLVFQVVPASAAAPRKGPGGVGAKEKEKGAYLGGVMRA